MIAFLKRLLSRLQTRRVTEIAAQLAYFLMLSFFPFLLFLLSLLSFTDLGTDASLHQILKALPATTASMIEPVLKDILANRSGALLGFSLVLALWSGAAGMENVLAAMERGFTTGEARHIIRRKLAALGATIGLALLIFTSLALQVFAPLLPLKGVAATVARLVLSLAILTLGLSALYRFGPAYGRGEAPKFRVILPVATVTGVFWMLASGLFSLYVGNFPAYAKTYGALAGVIVLLVWLFITALILLLGAEALAIRMGKDLFLKDKAETAEKLSVPQPVPLLKAPPKKKKTVPSFALGAALGAAVIGTLTVFLRRSKG